ncbi:hypothetical protein, partial [uncultured Rikenella sp.]|uniref:hypothetical protein n=1 Tax=uncultured Rikenella sp. TaxID=368003 RepID=UPI00260FE9C9
EKGKSTISTRVENERFSRRAEQRIIANFGSPKPEPAENILDSSNPVRVPSGTSGLTEGDRGTGFPPARGQREYFRNIRAALRGEYFG